MYQKEARKPLLFVLILAIILVFAGISYAENLKGIGATSGTCGTNLTWELADGTLTISGSGAMENYSSSIGAPWESVKGSITAVVINSDATSVGDYAFYECTNLAGVNLPATVRTIGEYAFGGCSKLPEITLQENLTSLKGYAFYGCSALKSIDFPASLTNIGSYCFSHSGLQSMTIPDTVKTIGVWAFSSCSSLKQIVFPAGITVIPGFVAYNCYNLEEATISQGTEEISSSAFSSCSKLKTITIPAALTSVASSAFSGCSSLSEVKYAGTLAQANAISVGTSNTYFTGATWTCSDGTVTGIGATSGACGAELTWKLENGTLTVSGSGAMENYSSSTGAPWESVKSNIKAVVINSDAASVGDYAFYGCTNLAGVSLPATIQTIGEYAFGGCGKLPEITLQENLTSLKGYAFYGCSALKSIAFPASLTSIGSYCFSRSGLQSTAIPNTVNEIGSWAFSSCSSLKKLVFPDGITAIPGSVAYKCGNLEEVILGKGTEEISSSAFYSCSKLETITIPAALTSVASSAFSGCSSLSEVKYAGTLAQANAISVGTSNTYFTGATWTCSDETVTGIGAMSGTCGADLTWELANGTLTISGSGIMKNYSSSIGAPWESVKGNITAVVINSGAESVGNYAFYGCTNLASVSLPATIQTIGGYAFGGCSKLPEITLQENLKSLKGYAFCECSALKSIAFPASLTSIGSYCFSQSGLQSMTIPNTVNEIGSWAFSSCSSLKKIVFPDGITAIPGFVAYNCDNLEEVILGEGTEEISSSAFSSGSKLKTITIPATLTSVASSAFSGCSSLSEVKYAGTEAQANAISIGTGNTYFTGATWSFGYRYKFTITFDSDGGSTVDPMTVEYGATVTAPANPTKAGWVFVAWVPALPETMPAEDIAVKATWAVSQAEVDAVIALINQLPANAGISDKTAVETARAAYNALTDDQKALISADILKKLTDAEAQVAAAEQAAADLAANQAAADAVAVLINQLPANAGIQDKPAVLAARAAYDALTDAQKALISADLLKRLTDAEAQVAAAEQSAADQAAADAVAALINKLPANVGAQDKAAVQAIRAAYDALTDAQKALISAGTLKKLTDAEAQVAAAEQAPADQAAANIVIEMIRQLPEPAGLQDKAAVEAARAAYNALTDAQKALISADILKKLTDAEAQVAAEQSAADQAAANIVIDMIRQLPEPAGLQDKAAVEAARAAYNALTDAQKALISEEILKKLTDAEAQVAAAEETALPTGSYTDPDGSGEYNISENGSATYVSPGSDAETVTIPDSLTVNGHTVPVTAIEDRAFYKNEKLKTVVIGKNVKLIGRNAFASCKRLVTVKGGKNIETIMDSAFASCQKLKNFPVLSKLKKIGNSAFAGNKALTQFTFGAKVEKIGKKAFSDCVKLKTIMIKTKKLTNKNVGANAFKNISKKATVKCPKGKLKEYRKLLAKKGMPGTVTFK